jgi:formamidopyrimidine-DNA glycosylase
MQGLALAMAGRRLERIELRRPDLRFPFPRDFAQRLSGRRIDRLTRRAKYILASIEGGDVLLMHLGMTGRFTIAAPAGRIRNLGEFYHEDGSGPEIGSPHDHVTFSLDDGTRIIYSDPRRFGMMDIVPEAQLGQHRLLRDIGVEPLGNKFHARFMASAFAGKAVPLKAALLDQRVVAGLGNIYVCEALHRARLSPKRKAKTLAGGKETDPRLDVLVQQIRAVLNEAIAAGGSTLRDYAATDGSRGGYQQRFLVYDREGHDCCNADCRGTIRRIIQSGRSTFYCPSCQR